MTALCYTGTNDNTGGTFCRGKDGNMELKDVTHVENIRFGDGNSVVIIDQTKLPNETVYLTLTTPKEMYDAIYLLQVRGAPAIGIFAAYSLSVLANGIDAADFDAFFAKFREMCIRDSCRAAVCCPRKNTPAARACSPT